MARQEERRRRRMVLFPLPFQGHLSPMLQLGALLHERGLAVTVLHTDFNAPDPARHPDLAFVRIHETFPDEVTSAPASADIVTQLLELNAATEAPFRAALARLLLEPLRVRDLIRVDGSDMDALCGFIIARVADVVRTSASGVVVNTFEAMELDKVQRELTRPAFAVGPLHMLSPAPAEQCLHAPDLGCLAWLDAYSPRSVLYVSLGSVACVDHGVFQEMAAGLAGSGVPFLWVVRPGSVHGFGDEVLSPLPDGVDDEIRLWWPNLASHKIVSRLK